jgi:hypothetical protein
MTREHGWKLFSAKGQHTHYESLLIFLFAAEPKKRKKEIRKKPNTQHVALQTMNKQTIEESLQNGWK